MRIATEEEVSSLLQEVFIRLQESFTNLYIPKRTTGEDKNELFMNEYGFTNDLICEQLLDLSLLNYSKTDNDDNPHKKGEVWFFGKILKPPTTSKYLEIYIKLKLQRKVVCISFHPKEFDIIYPYLNG